LYRRGVASGGIALSTGVDLYFSHTRGNAGKPRPSEIDLDLRKFIERCCHQQLRQTGKPICQRSGDITWLTTMPLAIYRLTAAPTAAPCCTALCRWSGDREGR
jgi:hypothetical protein